MNSALWADLARNFSDHAAWLLLSSVIALGTIAIVWWRAPALIQTCLRWLDNLIPGDFSALYQSLSRAFVGAVTLGIVAFWVVAVVGILGGDLTAVGAGFRAAAAGVLRWATNQGLKVFLVVALALLVHRFASRAVPKGIERYMRARSTSEPESEVQKDISTLSAVLTKATGLIVGIGALFMVLAQLGINLAPLLATAGVVGIAVGFGAQTVIRDILSGLFIILEKQYRVGDVVNIAGIGGLVEDINLRRTVLRDLDYTQHVIPNGEVRIASNMTKVKSRVNLNIPVAYKEDLEQVMGVLNQVGEEMARDAVWGPIILDPPKALRVDKFADSAIEIKVLGETLPIRQWDVMGEYRLRVKKAFDRLGIEIPYPHRTIYWGTALAGADGKTPHAGEEGDKPALVPLRRPEVHPSRADIRVPEESD